MRETPHSILAGFLTPASVSIGYRGRLTYLGEVAPLVAGMQAHAIIWALGVGAYCSSGAHLVIDGEPEIEYRVLRPGIESRVVEVRRNGQRLTIWELTGSD